MSMSMEDVARLDADAVEEALGERALGLLKALAGSQGKATAWHQAHANETCFLLAKWGGDLLAPTQELLDMELILGDSLPPTQIASRGLSGGSPGALPSQAVVEGPGPAAPPPDESGSSTVSNDSECQGEEPAGGEGVATPDDPPAGMSPGEDPLVQPSQAQVGEVAHAAAKATMKTAVLCTCNCGANVRAELGRQPEDCTVCGEKLYQRLATEPEVPSYYYREAMRGQEPDVHPGAHNYPCAVCGDGVARDSFTISHRMPVHVYAHPDCVNKKRKYSQEEIQIARQMDGNKPSKARNSKKGASSCRFCFAPIEPGTRYLKRTPTSSKKAHMHCVEAVLRQADGEIDLLEGVVDDDSTVADW